MMARIHKAMKEDQKGFTLVELLVVVIIIGILAAIAIPVFLSQRNKGYDSAAKNDARNLGVLEETYLTDSGAYQATSAVNTFAANTITDFKPTTGVSTAVAVTVNGNSGFCIVSKSKSANYFWYDSTAGGLTGPSATAPAGGTCATNAPAKP